MQIRFILKYRCRLGHSKRLSIIQTKIMFFSTFSAERYVYHSMNSMRKKAGQLSLVHDCFIDRIFGVCAPLIILVFFAFSHKDNDSSSPFPACSTHSLSEADWTFGNIIANDQINFTNVQPFLAHACSYQSIISTVFKPPHLKMC